MAEGRAVLLYRETLLASSEPFITAQAEHLRRHVPWYLGLRRAGGHPLPADRDLRWRPLPLVEPARRMAWKRWGFAPGTLRAVRAVAPAVLHAHFGRDAVQVLPLARRLELPLVVTFHGHDATRSEADLRAGSRSDRLFLDRWDELVATASRVIAVSEMVRGLLLSRGMPEAKVECHYIGVDAGAIASFASPEREPGLVVFTGRLVAQKGLDVLLRALVGQPARLEVLGDGPERPALEALARELHVDATFRGFASQEEVWSAMGRATVVVVPSLTRSGGWQEAFGLVATEAQAAGTPVLASTCGGLPEAIAPALDHLLFPQGDVAALAERLAALLTDPDKAARLGADAQSWVAAERNLLRQTERLDAIYEEVAPC